MPRKAFGAHSNALLRIILSEVSSKAFHRILVPTVGVVKSFRIRRCQAANKDMPLMLQRPRML